MARGPFDYADGEDEQSQPPKRVPKPDEVAQGTPGDPAAMQSHGTQGWATDGRGQNTPLSNPYDYHDPFAGIKQPDLPPLEQRPNVSVPQVGRAGSILGAVTGAVGGSQALKQRDWDTKYGAKIGGYEREVGLAKERGAAESSYLRSARIPGTAGGPLVQDNGDGTFSTIVQTPGGGRAPVENALPASSFNAQTNAGQRERTGAGHDAASRANTQDRVAGAKSVAETNAASRVKAAQTHANNTGKSVLMTDPNSGESYWIMPNANQAPGTVEPTGAPAGLVKPSAAPKPDTVTTTTGKVDPFGKPLPPERKRVTHVPPKGPPPNPGAPKLKPNFIYESKNHPGKTFTTDAQGNPPPGE